MCSDTVELGGSGDVCDVQVVFIEGVLSFYVQRLGEGFSVSYRLSLSPSFPLPPFLLSLSLSSFPSLSYTYMYIHAVCLRIHTYMYLHKFILYTLLTYYRTNSSRWRSI